MTKNNRRIIDIKVEPIDGIIDHIMDEIWSISEYCPLCIIKDQPYVILLKREQPLESNKQEKDLGGNFDQ